MGIVSILIPGIYRKYRTIDTFKFIEHESAVYRYVEQSIYQISILRYMTSNAFYPRPSAPGIPLLLMVPGMILYNMLIQIHATANI